jgi:hypothetical protein
MQSIQKAHRLVEQSIGGGGGRGGQAAGSCRRGVPKCSRGRFINTTLDIPQLVVFLTSLYPTLLVHTQRGCPNSRPSHLLLEDTL